MYALEIQVLAPFHVCCKLIFHSKVLSKSQTSTTLQLLLLFSLANNGIKFHGAIELVRGLKKNKNLTILNLSGNSIGDEGAEHLAGILSTGSALAVLKYALNFCCRLQLCY